MNDCGLVVCNRPLRLSELEVWGGALPSRAALLMTCLLHGSLFNDCTVVTDIRGCAAAMCARVL
jgi:hypothetical protein